MGSDHPNRYALILAGGDGARLRAPTDRMPGAPPKQFCALIGSEPLFIQTRRRVQLLVPLERTCAVVTRSHHRFYRPLSRMTHRGLSWFSPRIVGRPPRFCMG
jgi:mannose-1-phosphate guanylyltransferase